MCLRSLWSSMGVTSTRVPVRGDGTGSGRILSLCKFPSWSLDNPLPLWPWVVLSVLPSPLPSWHRQRRWWRTCKICVISGTHLAKEAGKAEKEWEKMCTQVQNLRSVVRGKIKKLEQDLKHKKEELAQLKSRKEILENSSFASRESVRVLEMSMGASAWPCAPKMKKRNKQKRHPGLPSQESQMYYKLYLVHL